MIQPTPSYQSPPVTAIIYVIGEVVISIVAIVGAMYLLVSVPDQGVRLSGAGLLSAVTVFWFQRRAAEQSNNSLATLANGKLTQLLQSQSTIQSTQSNLLSIMSNTARNAGSSADAAASSARVAELLAAVPPVTPASAPIAEGSAVDEPAWKVEARRSGWTPPPA